MKIAIEWKNSPGTGRVEVVHGKLGAGRVTAGKGVFKSGRFSFKAGLPGRLELTLEEAQVSPGANATRVSVTAASGDFSFFLRDVTSETPMLIPTRGAAVVPANDRRSYDEVADAVRSRGLLTGLQRIEAEPEETYEAACARNRSQMCPTWLGLSRDMRFFEVGYDAASGYWGYVQPRHHSIGQRIPETGDRIYCLKFLVGPGAACRVDIARRLEEGVLPILRSTQREDGVDYQVTAFATLETRPLTLDALRGSEWDACYPNTGGNMLTEEDRKQLAPLMEKEMRGREEETVLRLRVEAVNRDQVPRYAWFMAPDVILVGVKKKAKFTDVGFDGRAGFATFQSGRAYAVCRLNGRPLPESEAAILLQPGATAVLDLLIPHQPLPRARAQRLAKQDFDAHLSACRAFWKVKLAGGASISVPEPAVDERIRAGLLHCDIAALGREPAGPVLATIGWYAPIGSESAPIIQFFDSMGWHKLAERALEFFLVRQRADGFIQNFAGYQLETGPVLWTLGEHYRYTRNEAWVRRIKPKVLKACEYLLAWRNRNKKPELRGKGYGLLDGKVADPEDFFHSFMLNGLSYIGITRAAELLARADPAQSRRLAREARAFRADIRTAFAESLAHSPVIPLGDGTWVPAAPPWTECTGPVSLYAEGGQWCTHGAFGARDSLIGPLYLVIAEVLDAREPAADDLLQSQHQLYTASNAGLSQPYYLRHDYAHLARGETKAFLKAFYNQFSALQDRETYTFWEHYHGASQHKTHEEAWFLMQARWMLWLEEGRTLRLLNCIPRKWLEDGKRIELREVASYFGPLSLRVESLLREGRITASIECRSPRKPKEVRIRLPHPEGRRPASVTGGIYEAETETVHVKAFKGRAEVELRF